MRRFFTRHMFFLFVALSIISSLNNVALGQGAATGAIAGTVQDQSGGVIAGATVIATNPATNFSRTTTTGDTGSYRFDTLPVGTYQITAEAAGFKRASISQVNLTVSDVQTLDVKLEPGQVTETVTVVDTPSIVNTTSSTLGKAVENRTFNDLPILSGAGGRNPLALAPLQAGVLPAGQVGPFSVNGQRAQSNNFILDGGDSNDLAINVPDAIGGFSPDALQEFRIQTSTYSAEYGRNSGSIVTAVSKAGTNDYHGNLFEFFRNRSLNATPFFNNSSPTFNGLRNPKFNVNEFGGTFGGPLPLPRFGEGGPSTIPGKDRTFFFFSYLGFRRRQGVTNSATVPTQAQRDIIFANGTPQAIALLRQIPAANSGSTLFSSEANRLDRNQFSIRGDHRISDKNNFFVTFFREPQTFADPFAFGGSAVPGFGTSGALTFTNLILNDVQIISPKALNEVRFGFHRRDTLSVLPVNRTSPSALGIRGINPDDPGAVGPPRVSISGFSNFGNTIQGPQGRKDDTVQVVDNFSYNFGSRHFAKFGGDFRKFTQNQVFDFINNGLFDFDGSVGAALGLPNIPGLNGPLSDFARGLAVDFVQNSAGVRKYLSSSYNFYAQDDFKVKPRLTLNLGLRYEYNTPLVDSQDRVNTFRPGQQSTVFPTAPRGLVFPGDAGISRSTYKKDLNNFSPRVGFAYDVLGDGKLSVRGGYGLFYDIVISETTLQFLSSPPFAIQPFTLFTNINDPFTTSRINPIPQPFPFTPIRRGGTFDFTNIAPISLTVNDPNFRTPYSHQYNLGFQYEFYKGVTFELGYVGTTGVKLLTRREINPATVIPGAANNSGDVDARRRFNIGNPQDDAFGGAVFGGITNQETSANSNYNSLQATISKRFSKGLYFQNAYTYSHCIDNSSGLRSNNNTFNTRRDRGNCDQDIRQRNVASYLYELPFHKDQRGALGKLLGGFQISGVTAFQTGTPFDITEGTDRSLTGTGDNRPDFVGGNVTFLNPRNTDIANGGTNRFFNGTGGGTTTAGTNPFFRRVGSGTSLRSGAGRFGSLGRNVFHGPSFFNSDFSVIKRIRMGEQRNIEFRSEFFNIFNRANFFNPNGSISSSSFGRITGTSNPRLIQFALKYNF